MDYLLESERPVSFQAIAVMHSIAYFWLIKLWKSGKDTRALKGVWKIHE